MHLAVEHAQEPLSFLVTACQRHDSPEFQPVLERIRVLRVGVGRPRHRPDRVRADKAYGSQANRDYLRRRGSRCTIPKKPDQKTGALSGMISGRTGRRWVGDDEAHSAPVAAGADEEARQQADERRSMPACGCWPNRRWTRLVWCGGSSAGWWR
ncbi:transposase [Streptomyces sp. NPDC058676]|uniref:transposase n=1 Tax=Streptomyces sp. NPDC058676 TaxID=3346593 RepID=UPI00364896E5